MLNRISFCGWEKLKKTELTNHVSINQTKKPIPYNENKTSIKKKIQNVLKNKHNMEMKIFSKQKSNKKILSRKSWIHAEDDNNNRVQETRRDKQSYIKEKLFWGKY